MIHRQTLIAFPLLTLVVLSTGLGVWGINERKKNQALALQVATNDQATFHQIVNDSENIEQKLAALLITQDSTSYLSNLSALTHFVEETKINFGKLPLQQTTVDNLNVFFNNLSSQSASWLDQYATTNENTIHSQIQTDYTESKYLVTSLVNIQTQLLKINNQLTSPQILNQFESLNQQVGKFIKSETIIKKPNPQTYIYAGKQISQTQALILLEQYLPQHDISNPVISILNKGDPSEIYLIRGTTSNHDVMGTVSKKGGHVFMFSINRAVYKNQYNLTEIQKKAESWIMNKGITPLQFWDAHQYQHIAYITFLPIWHSTPVVNQQISIKMAMDSGEVLGFNADNYYKNQPIHVPIRKFSKTQLLAKLHPGFHVRMTQQVLSMDKYGNYQPVLLIYGTLNKETFRVQINQNTGKILSIDALTRHSD